MSDLESFGLTRAEARTYITLLSLGEATTSVVAHKIGLHVSQIYGILEKLERKGFVVKQPGRPVVYRAIEPGVVLSRIVKEMDSKKDRLIKQLSSIMQKEHKAEVPPIWVVRGSGKIVSSARDIVDKASIDILLSTNLVIFESLIDRLRKARERGVNIFLLLFPYKMPDNMLKTATSLGRVRLYKKSDFILISDSSYCLYVQHAILNTLRERGYAILTEEPSLVDLFMHNFINRWSSSQPVNDTVDPSLFPSTYTCHRLALSDIKWLLDHGFKVMVEVRGRDTRRNKERVISGVVREVTMDAEEGRYNLLIESRGGLIRAGGIDAYAEDVAAKVIKVWVNDSSPAKGESG